VPVSEPWTDAGNVWWTWLPDELQVESNEFPSNYPEIGYGHDPENLEVIYDPGIFSYPNKVDVTRVSKVEAHGRFTKYPGYTALVRDKTNGDILEVYRTYGSGIIVLSHLEYETADPWDVDYVENELYLISPARKDVGITLYIEDAVKGEDEAAAPLVNKAPGDKIDIVAAVSNNEEEPYDVDVVFEVPSYLSFDKGFTRNDFCDIDEESITPAIDGNKYTVTISLEGGKSKQVVLRFDIAEDAPMVCPVVNARTIVEGVVCSSYMTSWNMVSNVKAIIVTNRHLLIQRYGLDERIDKALNWAFSKLGSTEYKYECLSFVEDAYANAGSDPRNNIPIPEDTGFRYAKYVAEFLNTKIGTKIPPRGAWMFYDWTGWIDLNENGVKDSGEIRNWGHVGISLGDGNVIHALGKVQTNSAEEMEEISIQGEKLRYIGWAWPPLTPPISHSFSDGLLSYLYKISDWREENCIVYYVDHYDESLKDWDQNVDYKSEDAANEVANKIDDLIEKWYDRSDPDYLMIVGGDEIIPFYRITIEGYNEEDYNSNDPVLNAYDHEFFFTDMKYADTDDVDWTKGSVDLSIGRITAASAKDMRKLIENGVRGPANSDNVVVGTGWFEPTFVDGIIQMRDKKGFNILNDGLPSGEVPKTFNSTDWGADDLINLMKKGFVIFEHSVHGDYYVLYCEGSTNIGTLKGGKIESYDELIKDGELRRTIANHRPLFITDSCHTGLVTDQNRTNEKGDIWKPEPFDNLAWALTNSGASGYLAVTSFGWCGYSDKLHGIFYDYFIKEKAHETTYPVGESLKYAVTKYNPDDDSWGMLDTVAVTEPILIGVPWLVIDPLFNLESESNINDDFYVKISQPQYVAPNTYKVTIEINLTNYSISNIDGFDIINIDGSDTILVNEKPILPKVDVPILLPKSSNALGLSLIQNITTFIGYYNIPSFQSASKYDGCSLIPSKNSGIYPSFWSHISDFGEYKEVCISTPFVHYNPQTKETFICNYTKIEFIYQSPVPLAIIDLYCDKTEYRTGDTLNASVTMINTGANAMFGLSLNLALKDCYGQIVASAPSILFDLDSGETKTISILLDQELPHGTYLLEAEVTGSGALAVISTYIKIISGGIVDLSAPSEIKSGDDITFEVSFMNGKSKDVLGESVIYIYNPHGIEIAELHSLPTTFSATSITHTNITWSTVGREIGTYTASAMVYAGGESFGPVYHTFTIKPPDEIPPTTIIKIGGPNYTTIDMIYVTPETPFTLIATDNPGGSGVETTWYRIRNTTFTSPWILYSAPFNLSGLADDIYTIDFYSIDNAGNIEPSNNQTLTLFSWNYIFEDSYGRDTILKINAERKFFQFITPDKDYGIREATCMRVCRRSIIIYHRDDELRLITLAVDTKLDFCLAIAWDRQTRTRYFLIDRVGIEDSHLYFPLSFF